MAKRSEPGSRGVLEGVLGNVFVFERLYEGCVMQLFLPTFWDLSWVNCYVWCSVVLCLSEVCFTMC